MMYITETQTILESETVQISSEFATDSLHLTTVLMKIHCNDHSHYAIGVLASSGDQPTDFHMVHDVTRDPDEAEYLFDAIAKGQVTPCTLIDVLSDLLGNI